MKILIITQDEPFYLAQNLSYLVNNLPNNVTIVGCIVNDVSPFGKKESFLVKAKKTFDIFGCLFFLYYSARFLLSKMNSRARVLRVLADSAIPRIKLQGSVNSKESLAKIKSYNPDLLVSILGNEIFKKELIHLAPKGCINLHTALLPKYRGLMPSFWVLKNQEKETGVSVFFVDEGIDSGPIIVQKRLSLEGLTLEDVIKRSKKLGMEAIIDAIKLIEEGSVQLIPNIDSEKSYFTFPTREDVREFRRRGGRFF